MRNPALPRPRLFAHRGYSKLFTENTLPAFKAAHAYTPYLELDLWLSRDGKAVVHHDQNLDRVFGINENIWSKTSAQLRELFPTEANTHKPRKRGTVALPLRDIDQAEIHWGVPQFEELLAIFPEAIFNIELKHDAPDLVSNVAALLERYDAWSRVLVTAEQPAIMSSLRRELPAHSLTGFSSTEGLEFVQWASAGSREKYQAPGFALQVPLEFEGLRLDTPQIIEAAHKAGIEIHYWTVNEVAEARRLVAAGAHGIFTNDPEHVVLGPTPTLPEKMK